MLCKYTYLFFIFLIAGACLCAAEKDNGDDDNTPDLPQSSPVDNTPDVPLSSPVDNTPNLPPSSTVDNTPDLPPLSPVDDAPDLTQSPAVAVEERT